MKSFKLQICLFDGPCLNLFNDNDYKNAKKLYEIIRCWLGSLWVILTNEWIVRIKPKNKLKVFTAHGTLSFYASRLK